MVSAHFPTGSLTEGIALIDEIGHLTDEAEQQLLVIDLRCTGVTVSLTLRDIALARRISAAAGKPGLSADPAAVQLVDVTPDARVTAEVLPFWRALLGYRQIGDDHLSDPARASASSTRPRPAPTATASTWTLPSLTIRPRPASPPPWPPAAA